MTTFNVHFTRADGTSDCKRVEAVTPMEAATSVKEKFRGAIVDKVKRWKAPAEDHLIGGAA